MTEVYRTAVDRLGWLTLFGRLLDGPPTDAVRAIDGLLSDLAGGDGPTAVLGPVLPAELPGEAEHRAAVLAPHGVGVVVWTADRTAAVRRLRAGRDGLARVEFVPFAACPADVQRQLLPVVGPLLERLFREATTRPGFALLPPLRKE